MVEAPVITTPEDGALWGSGFGLEVAGTAPANTRVELLTDGESQRQLEVSDRRWSMSLSFLADGEHVFTAFASDEDGNRSDVSNAVSIIVDTTAPEPPEITAPEDDSALAETTLTFAGVAEAGSEVSLENGAGEVLGNDIADEDGAWEIDIDLEDGEHGIRATARDSAGNTSSPSDAVNLLIDTTAPERPVIVEPSVNTLIATTSVVVEGEAEPGSQLELFLDGESVVTLEVPYHGNFSTTLEDLTDGEHELSATATDALGNASAPSLTRSFSVDTDAPGAPTISSPGNGSTLTDNTPLIEGTAAAGDRVEVYSGSAPDTESLGTTTADSSGNWSLVASRLNDGSHTLTAKVTDKAGNVTRSESILITIDTTAPAAPVISAPVTGTITSNATPNIRGTARGTSVEVFDGATLLGVVAPENYGFFSFTPSVLAEGPHTLRVRTTDQVGHVSELSEPVEIVIDTEPPLVDAGDAIFTNAQLTHDATASDTTALTYLWTQRSGPGTVLIGTANAEDTTLSADAEGRYVLRLTATDEAGHSAYDEVSFVWDTTAPKLVTTSPVQGADNVDPNRNIHFGFDEPMASASLVGNLLVDDGAVSGSVSQSGANTAVFTPLSALAPNTQYTAKVVGSVTDLAGNPLGADASFSFTTAQAGLPVVEGLYQATWNAYVKHDGPNVHQASGTPCDGSESGGYGACLHAGELLAVDTGDSTCGNKTASDTLGAFDWTCVELSGTAWMVTSGLKPEALLSSLIDFDTNSFKPNSVTVAGSGGQAPFVTAEAVWWDNTFDVASSNVLDAPGTIYLATEDPQSPLVLEADRIALVTKPGVTIGNSVSGESVVTAQGQNFLWLEGSIDIAGSVHGVQLSQVSFSVVRGLDVSASGSPTPQYFPSYPSCVLLEDAANNSLSALSLRDNRVGLSLVRAVDNDVEDLDVADCPYFGLYSGQSSGNRISNGVLDGGEHGALFMSSVGDSLENFSVQNSGNVGVLVNSNCEAVSVTEVSVANAGSHGFEVGGESSVLFNVAAVDNGESGIALSYATRATLSQATTANNAEHGISLERTEGCRVYNVKSFNNGDAGIGLSVSLRSTLQDILAANNGASGISVTGDDHLLSRITAANNGQSGIELARAGHNALLDLALINNGVHGIMLSDDYYGYVDANENLLANIVAAHNGSYGVYVSAGADNRITGKLTVGGNSGGDCYVEAESLHGDLADDDDAQDSEHTGLCKLTGSGPSDFTLSTAASASASFVGKVGTGGLLDASEDSANPDDDSTPGTADYSTLSDWLSFAAPYRVWGLDGSSFPNADQRGLWSSGVGRIWDFGAAQADTGNGGSPVLLDVNPLPSGNDTLVHTWSSPGTYLYYGTYYFSGDAKDQQDCDIVYSGTTWQAEGECVSTFLINATELWGDDVGNDNGLCESQESCLFNPNIGAYQGHGGLQSAGAFSNGSITGVSLQQHSDNGY